jgi:protein-disulfide isomerase
MDRLLLAGALVAVVTLVAFVLRRRRPDPPTQPSWTVPAQLDRGDFDRPDAPWLVVAFTSATCGSCAELIDKARPLESDAVAVVDVEFSAHKDLHERYGIDAVPTLVVADEEGVVRASFVGPVTATDLWAAVAEARVPGSTPPG